MQSLSWQRPVFRSAKRLSIVQNRQSSRLVRMRSSNGATDSVENVVIIGSGPAGYTAAIYAARANLRPVVFEGVSAGGVRGGQLMTTTEVENYPGFPEGITGPDLMDRMRNQAERWGANLITDDVEHVDLSSRPFAVSSSEVSVQANTVIIATGATAKRLGIPSEQKYWSNGISACAICDGASPLFRNQQVAVVGGGDSAVEEAIYLTKYAKHVHLLVRGSKLRASGSMKTRAGRHPSVTIHYNTSVLDAIGRPNKMTGLTLLKKDPNTGAESESELSVRGLFYGIGHSPNSGLVQGQVALDGAGYIKVSDEVSTSVQGVYAAGDIHDTVWRQAVTAAGSGCKAAIAAERYLADEGIIQEYTESAGAPAPKQSTEADESQPQTAGLPEDFNINKTRFQGQYCLRKLYHESDRPIAVFYSQPTCGPCRSLKPIFNKVVEEFEGRMHVVDIDMEQDADIAEAGGVNGSPTVQIFHNKALVKTLPGVRMKKEYRAVIEECLNGGEGGVEVEEKVESNVTA